MSLDKTIEGINSILPIVSYRNTIMCTNTTIMQKQCTHESYSDLFAVIKLTAEGYSAAATASKLQWQNEREEVEGHNGTYWLIHTFILSACPKCWLEKSVSLPIKVTVQIY